MIKEKTCKSCQSPLPYWSLTLEKCFFDDSPSPCGISEKNNKKKTASILILIYQLS